MLKHLMLCVLIVFGGCSEGLFGNDSGIVYVLYDSKVIVPKDDTIPVDAVNEFLLQEGYTSRVIGTWYRENGHSVQKIYLGVDVDPSPLLSDLRNLPGVLFVELDMYTGHLRKNPPAGYLN